LDFFSLFLPLSNGYLRKKWSSTPFLGLAGYYRRFVPRFSELSRELTRLTKKEVDFEWNDKTERDFQSLKNALISEPIVRFPDFNLPFRLMCDASNFCVGAILGQIVNDKEHVVAYYSKSLTPTQCNYGATERELLAILLSVQKFRYYLLGRSDTIVVTDHKPLLYFNSIKSPNSSNDASVSRIQSENNLSKG